MPASTITLFIQALRAFSTELYAAHGGWDATRAARSANFFNVRG